jgi:hypothetical protein
VLDEDTRPSPPEPDADVTFSRRGLAAGQHLIDVHDHYRAELEQVRDLLARVAKGITAAGQARGEAMSAFFAAAYLGISLPVVLIGLISQLISTVDASA